MGILFYANFRYHFLGKTVVVTGANTGIGKETALDLVKRGAKVILACRDEQRATDAAKDIIAETGSDKVLVRIVDLSSFESVRAFARLINETEERLDILVNNAGFIGSYQLTKDGYESKIPSKLSQPFSSDTTSVGQNEEICTKSHCKCLSLGP